jgi:hypothetical protein
MGVKLFPQKFLLTGLCERKLSEIQVTELCGVLQARNYYVNRVAV